MRLTDEVFERGVDRLVDLLKCVVDAVRGTDENTDPQSTDNRHVEILDTDTFTVENVANYSYSVISGSAEVEINGNAITGIPAGFDARQGDSKPDALANDITITGESLGTRIIVYYELA